MSALDVDKLLGEVSPDEPCGPDLEYDPVFGEMERSAQIKPEQQFGDTIIPAEEPDWREIKRLALDVLGRCKDLRAAMYLARALVRTDGFAGLADSLSLLSGYIERYWETVHPRLDPDDGNDPTMRVNIIASVCDETMMLSGVRNAPLVSSRAVGRFCLRDVRIADGTLPAPASAENAPPNLATIEAAFSDASIEEIQETAAAISAAMERAAAIEAALDARVGASQSPDLSDFGSELKAALHVVNEQLQRRGVGIVSAENTDDAEAGGSDGEAQQQAGISGAINGRDDVIKALDKICEYYQKREPSSPVPLLLERAKRLVSKNFMEILEDMAPDGLDQAGKLAGKKNEN
jgi:type VI secretion system protein ImpA